MKKISYGLIALIVISGVGLIAFHHASIGISMLALPFCLGEVLDTGTFQSKVLKTTEALKQKLSNVDSIRDEIDEMKGKFNELYLQTSGARKGQVASLSGNVVASIRKPLSVSDNAARAFMAHFILHCEHSGRMEGFKCDLSVRQRMLDQAKEIAGISQRAAITTSDIPLPDAYGSEFQELIADFGVARRNMFHYPISSGVDRPPRMGTRPAFQLITMSSAFPQLSPTLTFMALEGHKVGGLVIVPREINDYSAVAMGSFLMRYGAVEFARQEDTIGFLADGSGTYQSIKGVCQIASENSCVTTLASTKTHPSDATLADFQSLRTLVKSAAITGGKYYINQTWETKLRSFKTTQDQDIFHYLPDGRAMLDGFPIVWTEVLQPYTTAAAASKFIAAFGRLDFIVFGEHMTPRVDTSEHVFFVNDQLATRFIEEIDFDYQDAQCMAVLQTAAS